MNGFWNWINECTYPSITHFGFSANLYPFTCFASFCIFCLGSVFSLNFILVSTAIAAGNSDLIASSTVSMVGSYSIVIILARRTDLKLNVNKNPTTTHVKTIINLAFECVVLVMKLSLCWCPCASSIITPMQKIMPETYV